MKYLQEGVAEAGTWTRACSGAIKICWRKLSACTVGHWPQPRRKSASWMWYRGFSPDSTTMVYVVASFNNGSRHLLLNTVPSRGSSSCLERICSGRSMTWLVRLRLVHLDDSVGEGTTQCCYENRCGLSGIDLGLDREHDAHETELCRVCESD